MYFWVRQVNTDIACMWGKYVVISYIPIHMDMKRYNFIKFITEKLLGHHVLRDEVDLLL